MSFPFQSNHAKQTMPWKSSNVSTLKEGHQHHPQKRMFHPFFRKENHSSLNININPTMMTKTERRWQSLERQWRCRQQDAGSVHARSQASRALFKRILIWNFPQKSTFWCWHEHLFCFIFAAFWLWFSNLLIFSYLSCTHKSCWRWRYESIPEIKYGSYQINLRSSNKFF